MSGRIVTFANQKGGVGKTTTAVSLAAALARHNQKVVLVDLDAQANATSALGVDGNSHAGIYDALLDGRPIAECVVELPDEHISIVPASRELSGAEVELVPLMAREHRLATTLAPLTESFDWVLVDCPPSLGLLTINALTASTHVVIPVQCEYMALEGLSRLTETLDLVRQNLNPALSILGIVLTMFDVRTRLSQDVVDEVRRHFPQTLATVIPRSVRLSEAPSHGCSIFRYEPDGRAALAYDAVARELLERVRVAV